VKRFFIFSIELTMAIMKAIQSKSVFIGKLKHGNDLLEEITEFCIQKHIRLGRISAIGAAQKACIGFYNQTTHEYQFLDLNQPLEITHLTGNVSIKDGQPMVHAHITLADEKGHCFGGHLAPGTIVFACELILEAFEGPVLERGYDDVTGLPLWEMEE
jgi:predicted DNA-binding protein with PD1-like motif